MTIKTHIVNDIKIAEVLADDIIIRTTEDGLDLLGDLYYLDATRAILHERHITPAFFDLKNGIAGDLLQKFTNYRMRLAVVGDFSKYAGRSLQDFIYESNKGRRVYFLGSVADALKALAE